MAVTTLTTPTAHDILRTQSVVTFFQPILSARQRTLIGAEALSRGVIGVEALTRASPIETDALMSPKELFDLAADEGLTVQMERLCRATAVRTFAQLPRPEDLILFLNFGTAALEQDPTAMIELLRQTRESGLSPRNVAIEILESAFEDTTRLQQMVQQFRDRGFLLVLDDVGAGHSNLDRIPMIKPDILKLDRTLVQGIEDDYHRQETLKSLVHLARRIGALVVAEGIETQQQAIVSLELGADLLQGFFLGRPERAGDLTAPDASARIDALARDYKAWMVHRINARKLQHRRFNIILNEILCELARCPAEDFDAVLGMTLTHYDNVECVYVLDESGTQVSSTVCNPRVPHRSKGAIFRPAPKGADHSLKEYYYVLLDVELHKYTTDPYVSLATGNLCRTISTCFRDARNNRMYIICIDVLCD